MRIAERAAAQASAANLKAKVDWSKYPKLKAHSFGCMSPGSPMWLELATLVRDLRARDLVFSSVDDLKTWILWIKFPALAECFEHRPAINIYWVELSELIRELRAS